MTEQRLYLASASVARRAGCLQTSYRTTDGRYIVNEQAVRGIVLTPEEYSTGLDVQLIPKSEALRLIAAGGHTLGLSQPPVTEATPQEEPVEPSEDEVLDENTIAPEETATEPENEPTATEGEPVAAEGEEEPTESGESAEVGTTEETEEPSEGGEEPTDEEKND